MSQKGRYLNHRNGRDAGSWLDVALDGLVWWLVTLSVAGGVETG